MPMLSYAEMIEEVDTRLYDIWSDLRDDRSEKAIAYADGSISMANAVGILSNDQAELWERRIAECPGHDDEGGRNWCAYGCDLTSQDDSRATGQEYECDGAICIEIGGRCASCGRLTSQHDAMGGMFREQTADEESGYDGPPGPIG